jgi:hypothetical protein
MYVVRVEKINETNDSLRMTPLARMVLSNSVASCAISFRRYKQTNCSAAALEKKAFGAIAKSETPWSMRTMASTPTHCFKASSC